MIDFYNAFISYKHAELDSKIAEHVQHNLERYRIPHDIRKKTGRKRIERVFRDQDELPITSDLSDTISDALSKSEYLIVICSHNTKQSIWVEREIEFFLKTHTKEQILTVLADGEPSEVIPDILKYDEKELQDVNGTTAKVRVPRDLLSCDYRMPLSRAKKLELPRLASTLIGCSYDELVRRQRVYRIRRAMILVSVLLLAMIGLITYMSISKSRVDAALEQAMVNRARFLAAESDNLYEQQRNREALYVALSALPSGNNPNLPVVGEAVSSLAQATYAYRGRQGISVGPEWDYSNGNIMCDFWVNEDGTRLAAVDELGVITMWNTEDHQALFTIEYPGLFPNESLFVGDDTLVLMGIYSIRGFDINDGTLKWAFDRDNDDEYVVNQSIFLMNDGLLMCTANNGTLSVIDSADGRVVRTITLSELSDDNYYLTYALSDNCSKLAFCSYSYENNGAVIGVLDIDSEQVVYSDLLDGLVCEMEWADDNRLMAMSYDLDESDSSVLLDDDIITPYERNIICLDSRDMTRLWDDSLMCTTDRVFNGFISLDANNMIGCYCGNVFICYDPESGSRLYEWYTNDAIIDASDCDGDGWPVLITDSGEMLVPSSNLNYAYLRSLYDFSGDLYRAQVCQNSYYTLQEESERIISYNAGVCDEEWSQTEGVQLRNVCDQYLDDNVLVLLSKTESDLCITVINPNDNTLIDSIQIDDEYAMLSDIDVLGADEDNVYISFSSYNLGLILYTINIEEGSYTSTTLSDIVSLYGSSISFSDGYLCYVSESDGEPVINVCPAAGGEEELFDVPDDMTYIDMMVPTYFPDASYIYLPTFACDYIISTETGEYTAVDLPVNWNGTVIVKYDWQLNEFIVSDLMYVLCVNADSGEVYSSFDNNGIRITGFDLLATDDGYYLLVDYNGGTLIRYNAYTGEYAGSSDVSYNLNSLNPTTFDYDEEARLLYVQQDCLTSVVEVGNWVELCHIDNSLGHHVPTDRFYTMAYYNDDAINIGYFRHYTLNELIARANEMLGGIPIPDELVRLYGL